MSKPKFIHYWLVKSVNWALLGNRRASGFYLQIHVILDMQIFQKSCIFVHWKQQLLQHWIMQLITFLHFCLCIFSLVSSIFSMPLWKLLWLFNNKYFKDSVILLNWMRLFKDENLINLLPKYPKPITDLILENNHKFSYRKINPDTLHLVCIPGCESDTGDSSIIFLKAILYHFIFLR